jgi:hypothetical protein
MRSSILLLLLVGLAVQAGCRDAQAGYRERAADAEPLHLAMRELTETIIYDIFSPPQAARAYAYSSIAAYEALRHDHPGFRTLAGQVNGLAAVPSPEPDQEYHLPLASLHAMMTVGKALTFSQERMDSVRSEVHQQFRRMGVPRPVFERSLEYGEAVAQHVLAWAAEDYFVQVRGYPKFTVTREPGRWIPTPPAYMDAIEPNWGRLRPFTMDSTSQFRPVPPLPFDMAEGSPFSQQVREVYDVREKLSDEERAIAAFWDCNPYVMNVRGHAMFATKKMSPGGHWINVVAIASRRSGADLMTSAEAYARTAIALADGFISSWEEKYRSNVARPETLINAHLDEAWEPLLQTPPFPEYTSGHSVISTAAAMVLTDQFGDALAYTDDTLLPWGLAPRSFRSFEQAAAEAAISRLYGGIHYRMAIDAGVEQGRNVGNHVLSRIRTREGAVVAQQAEAGASR